MNSPIDVKAQVPNLLPRIATERGMPPKPAHDHLAGTELANDLPSVRRFCRKYHDIPPPHTAKSSMKEAMATFPDRNLAAQPLSGL
jgi:hypothetical protein